MSDTRFVQIHFLTSYPASLLNRDDVGFAKRIPFGGVTRTRVSSQCLKRHWRTFDGEHSLGQLDPAGLSLRSRYTFDREIFAKLVSEGVAEPVANAVTAALTVAVLGQSAKAKKEKDQEKAKKEKDGEKGPGGSALMTPQVTVLGRPEIAFLLEEARSICAGTKRLEGAAEAVKKHLTKDRCDNLRALRIGAGLDAALFGRMVTSDILARCDAALHTAHAFTVHAEATESDYFSAVDDLLDSGDIGGTGSGHINSSELTSGLFYGYVVADVRLLVGNLGTDETLAANVLKHLVHLIATVTPGAKLGSTAPHAYAHLLLVERGKAQPRTLANAFLAPVRERPDLLANTYCALAAHLAELDAAYGKNERRLLALGPRDALANTLPEAEQVRTLAELAEWTAMQLGPQQ